MKISSKGIGICLLLLFLAFVSSLFKSTGNEIGNVQPTLSVEDSECFECHDDVDEKSFNNSIHGEFECIDCHLNIEKIPHEETLKKVNCGECHGDVSAAYNESTHGKALLRGEVDAPHCSGCHGKHSIRKGDDIASTVYPANLARTCAKCHADTKLVERHKGISAKEPYRAYEESVHGKALKEGNLDSASCNDCHSSHSLQPSNAPTSMVYRYNIPKTCSECHKEIYQAFMESIHGKAVAAGATDAPVCTDCHGEHSIKAPEDIASSVYSTTISKTTCPRCHESEKIIKKYGLASNRLSTYVDSYHGLADKAGSTHTANCASCHGTHDIYPSDDEKSSIHVANLARTCGKCHPGATENYAKGFVHVLPSVGKGVIIKYIQNIYIFLIVLVIGGMVFHNALDFFKKLLRTFREKDEVQFERLTLNQRIQHIILQVSFVILVITGFALKYPDAWWAAPIGGEVIRGILHRVAAVIFLALCFYHIYFTLFTKRGRAEIKVLLPTLKDAKDVIQMFKYYFGVSEEKAKFGRCNYIDKSEYWAMIWGTVVMAVTGLLLWFEEWAMVFLPKWALDVATVIHYYEAVLATLAILVWHFYATIFNPDSYPMKRSWITGKVSEHEMLEEHPLEYEQMQEQNSEDA